MKERPIKMKQDGLTSKRGADGKVAFLLFQFDSLAHTEVLEKFSKPFPFAVVPEIQCYLLSYVGRDDDWLYERSQLVEPRVFLFNHSHSCRMPYLKMSTRLSTHLNVGHLERKIQLL